LIYTVGDVHGQITQLLQVLEFIKARWQEGDEIVFLGDYTDRGENSRAVIDCLIDFKRKYPRTVFLRGNHDWMMITAYNTDVGYRHETFGNVWSLWVTNGGHQTLQSYSEDYGRNWRALIPQSHMDFLNATRMQYESDRYCFVHAGLLPTGSDWKEDHPDSDPRLWIRNDFIHSGQDWGKTVVFGHTPQRRPSVPLVMDNKIGVDTGAVYGFNLTCLVLDDDWDNPKVADMFQAPCPEEAEKADSGPAGACARAGN
jgi:serine/threonine protein phosphatase 1